MNCLPPATISQQKQTGRYDQITESYSEESEALFSPGAFLGERKYLCYTAIATFSGEIYQAVIDKYPHREVGNIYSANRRKPIYAIEIKRGKTK